MTTKVIVKNGEQPGGRELVLSVADKDGKPCGGIPARQLAAGEVCDIHLHSGQSLTIGESEEPKADG